MGFTTGGGIAPDPLASLGFFPLMAKGMGNSSGPPSLSGRGFRAASPRTERETLASSGRPPVWGRGGKLPGSRLIRVRSAANASPGLLWGNRHLRRCLRVCGFADAEVVHPGSQDSIRAVVGALEDRPGVLAIAVHSQGTGQQVASRRVVAIDQLECCIEVGPQGFPRQVLPVPDLNELEATFIMLVMASCTVRLKHRVYEPGKFVGSLDRL